MAKTKKFPTRAELIEATYKALIKCNGSATNNEIQEHVITILSLSDQITSVMHTDNMQTKLQYELRWARTYLKKYGAIQNSKRGLWIISVEFSDQTVINGNEVCQKVREIDAGVKSENPNSGVDDSKSNYIDVLNDSITDADEESWRAELSNALHKMNYYAFERLTMRLLRECGFSKVSVTKKSGDDGIDGFGTVMLNGMVSINVAFQCKRYSGAISNSQIRDFRGSFTAGVEKGIFITTGAFSNPAIQEATNPGKTPTIDLIDGEQLLDLLIEHEIGIKKEIKTVYRVDKTFFDEI